MPHISKAIGNHPSLPDYPNLNECWVNGQFIPLPIPAGILVELAAYVVAIQALPHAPAGLLDDLMKLKAEIELAAAGFNGNGGIPGIAAALQQIVQQMAQGQQQTTARLNQLQQQTTARFNQLQQQTTARFNQLQQQTTARFNQLDARFDALDEQVYLAHARQMNATAFACGTPITAIVRRNVPLPNNIPAVFNDVRQIAQLSRVELAAYITYLQQAIPPAMIPAGVNYPPANPALPKAKLLSAVRALLGLPLTTTRVSAED